MKKQAIAAAATVTLLGVVLVGGAAVSGSQVKKRLQAAPRAWSAQWPMLKVVDQHYERGLFSATHTVSLQLGCEGAGRTGADAPLVLGLRQRVRHGPLPGFSTVGAATVDTELVLPDAARKQLAALIGDQPPFTAHTVVGFLGGSRMHVAMPAFKFTGSAGQQFAFEGLSGDVRDNGRTLAYDVTMPSLHYSVRDERLAVETKLAGARMHGEIAGSGSWWLRPGQGEAELTAFEMSVVPGTAPAQPMPPFKLALRQLKMRSANTLDKELLTNVAQVTGQGMVNEVKLDRIELQASFRRLHAPSYEHLVQRLMDMSAATCDMKQAISPQVMLAEMQQDVMALLPYNPEYALDKLALDIDGRHGELSYAFGVNGVTAEDTKLPLPALMMGKGQFRGQAKLPAAWIEQAVAHMPANPAAPADPAAPAEMVNVMLTKMTSDGFVVREGDMLSTQFSFEHGQLLVNGKPVGRPPAQ